MLNFEEIKELLRLVADKRLDGIEIERAGFRLVINGKSQTTVESVSRPTSTSEPESIVVAEEPVAQEVVEEKPSPGQGAHVVSSPIVGTFYTAPAPDADPYARVGDRVRKGQVLCIIEAMKLMNEIESDADGVVVEIFPKNAQPVEFGEPLFAIQSA